MFKPKIIVKATNYDWNIQFICDLLSPELGEKNSSLPFVDRTYGLFPKLRDKIKLNMTPEEMHAEVEVVVKDHLNENKEVLSKKILSFQQELDILGEKLLPELFDLFQLEWPRTESQIVCYLGCFPVFPRKVITKEFWVNYSTVKERVLASAIHEINHFVLFEKWKSMHGYYRIKEPEHPESLWFLEEIAVDPTLNEHSLQKIAPYSQKAYPRFYSQSIGDIPVMDHIKKIYKNRSSMADFLDRAYMFIVDNHNELVEKCG